MFNSVYFYKMWLWIKKIEKILPKGAHSSLLGLLQLSRNYSPKQCKKY